MNDTIKSIKARRSVRVYTPDQIPQEALDAIIEAGLYAPSAMNGQPWHMTVIQNREVLNALNASAMDAMAASDNPYFKKFTANESFNIFYHAPTAVVISGAADSPYAGTDCAAAAQNMLVAAESLNIGSCWVGLTNFALKGEKGAFFKEQLQIPEGYEPLYTLIFGHKRTGGTSAPQRKAGSVNYVR